MESFSLNSFHAAAQLAAKGLGTALLPERFGDDFCKRDSALRRVKPGNLETRALRHSLVISYPKERSHEGRTLLMRHLTGRRS